MNAIKALNVSIDGIDFYVLCDDSATVPHLSSHFIGWLSSHEFVTIHTSLAHYMTPEGIDLSKTKKALNQLAQLYQKLGAYELVIHADCLEYLNTEMIDILQQELDGISTSFEMMSKDKAFGNRIGHFDELLSSVPEIGITIDLAHLDEMRASICPTEVFQHLSFRNRIHLVHGSLSGKRTTSSTQKKWYGHDGIDHLPCVLDKTQHCKRSARLAKGYPLVLEGAIPPGESGLLMLKREISWWKELRSEI